MFGAIVGISRLHIKTPKSYESFGFAKTLKQCVVQEFSQWKVGVYKIETRYYSNCRAFVPKKWSSTKHMYGQACHSRPILSTQPGVFQYYRNTATSPLTINTKVKNNVMLYRFEKPWIFKCATVFGVMALIGCLSLADMVYKVLCKGLWVANKDLKTRLKDHLLPLSFITTAVIAGPLIAFFVVTLTLKAVKYIILRKGGQEVTLVTYHPYKHEVVRTVPLDHVSSLSTRGGVKAYIPIKVKGYKWNFMCDKNGHFVNEELFDNTVGMCRFK